MENNTLDNAIKKIIKDSDSLVHDKIMNTDTSEVFTKQIAELKKLIKPMFTDTKNQFDRILCKMFVENCEKQRISSNGKGIVFDNFFPKDRYFFDFNMDLTNWMQVDSEQDAPYFGTWCSPALLTTLSYVEGDVYLVVFGNMEDFRDELQRMMNSDMPYRIDPGLNPCEENVKFLDSLK